MVSPLYEVCLCVVVVGCGQGMYSAAPVVMCSVLVLLMLLGAVFLSNGILADRQTYIKVVLGCSGSCAADKAVWDAELNPAAVGCLVTPVPSPQLLSNNGVQCAMACLQRAFMYTYLRIHICKEACILLRADL